VYLIPLLFPLAMDWLMKRTTAYNKRGIQWTLNSVREDLDFADLVGLLFSRHSDIKEELDRLSPFASQIGTKVNVGKTKLMRLNTTSNQSITVNSQLEELDEFTYLGRKVSTDGDSGKDVSVRAKPLGLLTHCGNQPS